MAAAAGILATDALGLPAWYEAGAQPSWLPPIAQLPILALVMGFLETKRYEGFVATGGCGLVNSYPFDPMGMGKSPDRAVKEVKNGRLAMIVRCPERLAFGLASRRSHPSLPRRPWWASLSRRSQPAPAPWRT